jgi:hypothetical protein
VRALQQHLGHLVSASSAPLRLIRTTSALVTVVALTLLGLVVAESGGSVTRHTVVSRHEVPARVRLAAPPSVPSAAAVPSASSAAPTLVAPTPLVITPTAAVASAPSGAVVTSAATTAPAATAPTTPGAVPPAAADVLPACPLPLPTTTASGGLQSLIGFAPLFGPFSAEAFASAATFQPLLELIGPFLVTFAKDYAPAAPSLAPLLAQVESLENEGYSLIAPFYGPYRSQFLKAETALATALAPVASSLVDNPASACVVDLEGVLTAAH